MRDVSDDRKEMFAIWAEGNHALAQLGGIVRRSGLEASLLELVKTRASQINGCAYCLDMHTKDARAAGETEQRLYGLNAWRDAPFYTDRERAALALTESVTLIASSHPAIGEIDQAASVFSPDELTKLVFAIIEINAWNRLAIATGVFEPGSYQPPPGSTRS